MGWSTWIDEYADQQYSMEEYANNLKIEEYADNLRLKNMLISLDGRIFL